MKKSVMTVAVLLIASAAGAGVKFITSYRAPGVPAASFTGQKVAAVLFTQDDNLRVSIEEALARQLTDRGVTGVAAYRLDVLKPAPSSADSGSGRRGRHDRDTGSADRPPRMEGTRVARQSHAPRASPDAVRQ